MDTIDFETNLKTFASDVYSTNKELNKMRVKNKSIVGRAKKSIFNFPVFISQSVRVNEAHIISKMFERVYATFVQTALAQNQVVSVDEFNDLEFLKKFHTNLDQDLAESTGIPASYNIYYKPIDFTDECLHDSLYKKIQLNERVSVIFKGVDPRGRKYDLVAMHNRLINEPLTGFSYLSESELSRTSSTVITKVESDRPMDIDAMRKEVDRAATSGYPTGSRESITIGNKPITARKVAEDIYSYYDSGSHSNVTVYHTNGNYVKLDKLNNDQLNKAMKSLDNAKLLNANIVKLPGDKWGLSGKISSDTTSQYQDPQFARWNNLSQDYGSAPKMLRDTDIKKINGMLPYTIEAKFMVKHYKGLVGDSGISIIIGIKTVLHLIQPKDLGDDIKDIILGNVKAIQKIRYTTGEIKFKDYLFGMTGAKKSAAQGYKGKKKWLAVLKKLGDYSKLYKSALRDPVMALNKGLVPIPNSTIILTSLDVENIKANSGVDLNKISVVRIVAKQLFLICFVIVDSSAGKMKVFYPDSDSDWDVQSLASVEADLAKTDNSELVKELNRVVNR